MLKILIIEQKPGALKSLKELLRRRNLKVVETISEDETMAILRAQEVDAVIATESDFPLLKRVITAFPMTNYALASSLRHDDFHELTEGYGIFAQLPLTPEEDDVVSMVDSLAKLTTLSSAGREGNL